MKQTESIQGVLLLYHHPIKENAPTIREHIDSFGQYSQFKVWPINTEFGFPIGLSKLHFQIIVLHYSLFDFSSKSESPTYLNDTFLSYIKREELSYKIAFFQDEFHFCQRRFAFLDRFHIDCVYSLLKPAYFKDVYQKYTKVPKLEHNLTGYVSDDLIKNAQKFSNPRYARRIDVGYRGRRLPFYSGKGSQEKYEIGVRFLEHANGLGFKLDIETDERSRLYGEKWYRFLGNCKACLGVEAGVSIFDTEDIVRTEYERLIAEKPRMSFEEMSERLLSRWEGNIPYRTISPRHFEAAAFRICQILYEGDYQGIMKPMVHYIPLKKDFSNFDEVIRLLRDDGFCNQITENCWRELISSGRYSYQNFLRSFDQELVAAGFTPSGTSDDIRMVSLILNMDRPCGGIVRIMRKSHRQIVRIIQMPLYGEYPGKRVLVFFGRPVVRIFRYVRQYLKTAPYDTFE
jgi:hypothetical protein